MLLRLPSTLSLRQCNPLLIGYMNITPIKIRLRIISKSLKVEICTINYKG